MKIVLLLAACVLGAMPQPSFADPNTNYAPVAIGVSPTSGGQSLGSNGMAISSVGGDIGGASDQFEYSCVPITGDFDFTVNLTGLGPSDVWAKAGLMARETLATNGRFAASLATPGMGGAFFEYRDPTNSAAVRAGSFPVNYPSTWLRLKRAGNVFTAFAGYDGVSWTQTATGAIAMPAQIYFGMAASSYSLTQSTTARFLNPVPTGTNAVIGGTTNPHEPLGPCSRKTGIVISEIMWKPAPRTDGNNLEFLELYNSTPYFHDISGYRVVCADMNYTIPPGTILAGGAFLVLAASPGSMENVYGITNVLGPYTGSLKKSETLELLDEQGAVLLTVPYSDTYPWPVATDATGHSLVLAYPSYGEGNPQAWDISDVVGGSPGGMEPFHPSPLRAVVINEILAHSENPAVPQFVELYNHSTVAVDLTGCILTDDFATNKFVIHAGTTIAPDGFLSFDQQQLGFTLNGAGETLYFIKPDGSRVLDAVQFEAQADGVSLGRWPNGANDFYPMAAPTPGATNSPIRIGPVAINELMYDPISGNDDDQYIELYNQSSNAVSLANWQFTAGVTFTFPANATIPAGGYLVVARNQANLFAKYSNLNSGNTVGNYTGKLSHNGERVALAMPQLLDGTATIYVVQDEVAYGTGGRWGQWSAGGGSSLELIDPHSNHRLAANWADSDETQKSAWTNIESTSVLEYGANFENSIEHAQIGLLDTGECLVDNVEADDSSGVNYVSNPTFESGLTNWLLQGCMVRSSLENSGYQSAHSLHIRCTDRIWTGDNSCQVSLNANTLASNQVVTLRFKARWLRGWPEAVLRLNGNWEEAAGTLPVPPNLGTPGAPNSTRVTNAGPAIYNVTHSPSVPAAGQQVMVTAQVHDPDGLQSMVLKYRIDPATNYTTIPMRDDALGADVVAQDGIYSAAIPGQKAGVIVAFYITATDSRGATTRFPALLNNNGPTPECVVMFGDGNPGGSFGVYHLWITQTNATRWSNLGPLSNELLDGTFVNNNRVIYNMTGRFAGSPSHQNVNTPNGNLCHYKFEFNDDDKFLGATDFNKIHQPGNAPGDDGSLQREQTAYTFLRALGQPWLYRRYVVMFVNGSQRGTLMEDTQVPGADMVKEHFPNDTDGFLYKMQPWTEFGPTTTSPFSFESFCNIMPYVGANGQKKVSRYRYMFEMRRTPDSDSDFTNVFSLVDAASSHGTANYVASMENIANMENWMRVFAANHAAGNRDVFGALTAQNLYGYIGTLGTAYSLLMWDFNYVMDHGEWAPGQNLFLTNPQDPDSAQIYTNATFRRMYWRALENLVNGPLLVANTAPLCNAKYNAFVADGFSVENPNASMLPWIGQAQTSIAAQLAAVDATNFSVSPAVVVNDGVAYISGVAPVAVSTVLVNGALWTLTWTSLTNWRVALPLPPGTNSLTVQGIGDNGLPIAGASDSVTAVNNAAQTPPAGNIVINEIMFQPAVSNAEYVELYNNSVSNAFDLSNWQLPVLGYTFSPGSWIGPNGFLVLAANRAAFAAAYGATIPVFDTFSGTLAPGQLLSLVEPSGGSNVPIAQVLFDDAAPWPTNAVNPGVALQLVDSHQDNWRVGNWSTGSPDGTPGASNSVAASLPPFAPLWINEVDPDNLTGITNSAGQHAPWLELYNPSATTVTLTNLYLTATYTNLTNWAFPPEAAIGPGQFLVIFADGQTNLSTLAQLHTSFALGGGNGSVALSRLYNGQPQVLDYINYTNLPPNWSFGSLPDGQSFVRVAFYSPTPGTGNSNGGPAPSSFIAYNTPGSVYAQNFDSLPDPGASSVNTANPVAIAGVTYSLGNPLDFASPVSSTGNGGLGLPGMAGWYGLAELGEKFGATDGDQTTGGQLSFGPPSGGNRALGLLATSSTGWTAFGAKLVNNTGTTLDYMNLQVTGEVWRQSNLPKLLECYYYIDPTAVAPMSTRVTGYLTPFNVDFSTVAGDSGGVAVDGTATANQINLAATNQPIAGWTPGAALWLVWEMADDTGKAQGLAIDNLSFAATAMGTPTNTPPISAQMSAGSTLVIAWPAPSPGYQLYSTTNLAPPVVWSLVTNAVTQSNGTNYISVAPTNAVAQFFQLISR